MRDVSRRLRRTALPAEDKAVKKKQEPSAEGSCFYSSGRIRPHCRCGAGVFGDKYMERDIPAASFLYFTCRRQNDILRRESEALYRAGAAVSAAGGYS